jgi:1,4-alpha-glucan branching enzyme
VALGAGLLLQRQGRNPDEMIIVRFELRAPDARDVAVVGNWNRWDPQAQKLGDPDGDGVWEIEIPLKRGEEHQYQFLIDGTNWIPDPDAPLQVDDGFGGVNSVLQI